MLKWICPDCGGECDDDVRDCPHCRQASALSEAAGARVVLLHRERRRHKRYPESGQLRILWEDDAGRDRISNAEIVDISVAGLRLRVSERIPERTYVTCNDPARRISGRGTVRHCRFSRGKYIIGLEFPVGTGWREPTR